MKNTSLFNENTEDFLYNKWEEDWQDMPEFCQKDKTAYQAIKINFKNKEDREEFSKLIGQPLTKKTQSVWFPKAEIETVMDKRYKSE